ncbi:TIGR02530 family flagellar biosynthesis protein [Gracilibacillus salinarum]|uniref:Flagellar protein n=1 Tax=Gracilibacillus salinarum TaxID=2932255 RepID=A0ABY4GNM5_9BACI|nr:TIGR02530 family flagellar biosynthesis protein [Gracilibacillus salinarum]UOQ85580.1 flagellar protein [Gracilibacillus salinarum]
MVNRIHAFHPTILPGSKKNTPTTPATVSFKDVLSQQHSMQISKHARDRMHARNIEVSNEQWTKIESKLQEANQKGVKESLVITDEAAFVVNASNKTVITAMEKAELKSKIFTNINGTIIME